MPRRFSLCILATLILVGGVITSTLAHAEPPKKPVDLPPALAARAYAAAVNEMNRFLSDFEKALSTYYELKRNSAKPNEFVNYRHDSITAEMLSTSREQFAAKTVSVVTDFDSAMYLEFKNEFDTMPSMKNNTFIHRIRDYGVGQANDVVQQLVTYAIRNGDFQNVDPEQMKRARVKIMTPVRDLAIQRVKLVFRDVSKRNGYLKNAEPQDMFLIEEWESPLEKFEKDLQPELKKIGFNSTVSDWAPSCQAAFGNLAK